MKEEAYRNWLYNVKKVRSKTKRALMDYFGSAKAVYAATQNQLQRLAGKEQADIFLEWKNSFPLAEAYEEMLKQNIHMVSIWDKDYPERLRKIKDAPLVLYYKGSLPKEEKSALAIIGARECSEYGSYIARAFGSQLGALGVNIISGMARGIDGIGQEAALMAGGYTCAVLGCGADICYPASNRELYEAIAEKGCVLSPFPVGTKPGKNLFPYRNKLVAGLADAVLVVEARQKSGTLITVDMALEQGKDVYAVPGRLTDRLSDGCNMLLRQGAGIALSPEDMAAELAVLKNRRNENEKGMETGGKEEAGTSVIEKAIIGGEAEKKPAKEKNGMKKTAEAKAAEMDESSMGVLKFLDLYPKSSDEILAQVRRKDETVTLPQLLFELIQLCMEGKASQIGGNYFIRKL